jgi:BASS family bile acid:Na+ symporter
MQVFAIGLGGAWHDAVFLFRRPRLLVKSILATNVMVPILAILLIKTSEFHVAEAITPVPLLLSRSQIKAGAASSLRTHERLYGVENMCRGVGL